MDRNLYKVLLRLVPVCFLTLAVSIQCLGQKATESMIYCRDGSVYRGIIVKEDAKTIQIATVAHDTLNISRSTVKHVKKTGDYLFHSKGKMHDIKGFFWAINLGFTPNSLFTLEDTRSEHFELLFGWRFNKNWTVANGVGSEFNVSKVSGFPVETSFTSFFLYGRYYFTDGRPRLFAYSRIGFGGGQTGETEANNYGGFQWQGGGGVHFASRRNSRFIISLGYYLQKANGTQFFLDDFGNEVKIDFDILITRPILKVGIEFR